LPEPAPNAAKNPLKRLIAASDNRKSRLHDELGGFVPLGRLVRNGPRALATGLARLTLDRRPERPWISYDAQAVLAQRLNKDSSVLEFGSGMSTIWYARHAGRVVSIEDKAEWHAIVQQRLSALGNVDYKLAKSRTDYVALAPDERFDLIMIDGSWRDECARFAIAHLVPGGVIYLDNSDKALDPTESGDIPAARSMLLEFAKKNGLPVREFIDFAPTQLFVQRGMMIG
jgi:hypothetical protein